jgi:hypothetical protein
MREWQGWALVAAWVLAAAVVFWLLVAPPWGERPVEAPTSMSGGGRSDR